MKHGKICITTLLACLLCAQSVQAAFIPKKKDTTPAPETGVEETVETVTQPQSKPVVAATKAHENQPDTVYPKGRVYTVPENVTYVDNSILYLKGYETIYIGKQVDTISLTGAMSTEGVTIVNYEVDPDNPYYTSINGVLYDKDVTRLILIPYRRENVVYTIPKTVSRIDTALSFSYIDHATWQVEPGSPYFVADGNCIYDHAKTKLWFVNNVEPEDTLVLPDTVTTIGNYALTYQDARQRIHIPSSVTVLEGQSAHCIYDYTPVVTKNSCIQILLEKAGYPYELNDEPALSPLTLGTITTSADSGIFTTGSGNRLFLNVPCSFPGLEGYMKPKVTATIYDAAGKSVGALSAVETLINKHVILSWNGMAAQGNKAGISTATYVPAGTYTIQVKATTPLLGKTITTPVQTITVQVKNGSGTTSPYGSDNTVLTPIYTDDATLNYRIHLLLQEIIQPGMTNAEKLEALYTWLVKNCVHNYYCDHCTKGLGDYYGDITEAVEAYDKEVQALLSAGKADLHENINMLNSNGNNTAINCNSALYNELNTLIWGEQAVNIIRDTKANYLLEHRNGICSYFSSLFSAAAEQMGFDSGIVIGQYINNDGSTYEHYWNYVMLNGVQYWVDCDISAILYRSTGTIYKDSYFLKKDTDPIWTAHHKLP